jgi:hypothetical protein
MFAISQLSNKKGLQEIATLFLKLLFTKFTINKLRFTFSIVE